MANAMVRLYTDLAGVDFTNDPAKVALNRSPNAINMFKDYTDTQGSCVQTRYGTNYLQNANGEKILGMFKYTIGDKDVILVHTGHNLKVWNYPDTNLYKFNSKIIFDDMSEDHKSSFVVFNDKCYIVDGKNYLVYDGETIKNVAEDAFVPTTTISRGAKGGGTLYQDVNVLTHKRKNSFVADGTSVDYYLDVESIDNTNVRVWINDIEQDRNTFSVNTTLGCITFNTAPVGPDTEGKDNLVIEFEKAGTDYDTRIPNCLKMIVFDNRIFFTGNKQFKNAIFHSELNDASYISDLNYYQDGSTDSAIKDFCVGNNLLWVFKNPSQQNDTIFYHTPSIDAEAGKIYPSKQGNIATGCVSSAYNFNDDIVFASPLGIEGITGDIDTKQLVSHRSSLIDAKFVNEDDYEDLVMVDWKGYLVCLVNNHFYLADSRQVFQGVSGNIEYEWYYWQFDESISEDSGSYGFIQLFGDITTMLSYNGDLIIGTSKGYIFNFDKRVTIDAKRDTFRGYKIYSCWYMPRDIFGDTNNLKTTNKRGGVAKIKTIPNGKVKVAVETNRKPNKEVKTYSATGFDFNNIDFENFAFTTKDMSYIVFKIKMKKFIELQLKFYSDDGPFGLYDATLEVYQGSYIKRT